MFEKILKSRKKRWQRRQSQGHAPKGVGIHVAHQLTAQIPTLLGGAILKKIDVSVS